MPLYISTSHWGSTGGGTATAVMVGALLTALTPTAAQAATCCYNMKNANGKFMGVSGNNIIVSTTAVFWTSLTDSNYLTN